MEDITDKIASEKGTFIISISFLDEEESAVVPNSINYSLSDQYGNIIDDIEQVEVATPATTISIVLSGSNLKLVGNEIDSEYVYRYLVIEAVYNSDAGSNLPFKEQIRFKIENLKFVS